MFIVETEKSSYLRLETTIETRVVYRKYPINSTVQSTLKSTVQSTVKSIVYCAV